MVAGCVVRWPGVYEAGKSKQIPLIQLQSVTEYPETRMTWLIKWIILLKS